MASKKLLVVIGATGTQGSSVVETFLKDPAWRIRGITRNTNSDASQKLTSKGVEMVAANLDDPASLDVAFNGAHAIFAVTDFWKPFSDPANHAKVRPGQTINEWTYEYELQQGKNIFDAAAKVDGLERFIFSSLSSAKKWSKGKYTWVYHFDSKADAVEYGKQRYPTLWKKTSLIIVGFYLSNYLGNPMMPFKKVSDDVYEAVSIQPPTAKLPLIATEEDTGPFVRALLTAPPGINLLAYRDLMPGNEFRQIWDQVTGKTWKQRQVTFDEFKASMPEVVGREVAETFAYATEFGYEGRDDPTVVHPKDLGVPIELAGTVEDWVRKQDWSRVFAG